MNANVDMLMRNLNGLIYKYNQLAIKHGKPIYKRPLLPPNMRVNGSMLRFEYGLVLRKLKRLLHQADTGNDGEDDTRVQSVDLGVTIDAFKANTDGITMGKWTYLYNSTAQIVTARFTGTATGELELKLSDMPAEVCKFTGGESLPIDNISFFRCTDLTKLTLREWDLGDIDDMSRMFEGCSSMITIDSIQGWDTSKVEDMSYMFYRCSDLSEFSSNTWDTSNVKKMNGMFHACTSLTNVDGIRNWDTSKVEQLNNTFSGCKELTAIDLSKWVTSLVTDTTYMLLNCDKLERLTINSSVYDTFMSATNLGIDLDDWYYLSTSVGSTNSWGELGVEDEAATIVPYQTTVLRYDGLFESLNTDIVSGSFKYFFTTDISGDGRVFNAQLADKAATTPSTDAPYMVLQDNNKTLVPVASYANIFERSRMGPEIDVGEWDTRNVNNLVSAFYFCTQLEKIDGLDKWNTGSVKKMTSMFQECTSLTKIDGIQNWDTSKVEDMSYMFEQLPDTIRYFPYVSKWNTSNLSAVSGMFVGASGINALMLNSWVVSERLNVTDIFKDMTSLHALTITESMFNRLRNSTDSGITFTDWYYGSTKIGTQTWSDLGLSTPTTTFTKYTQNEKKLDGEFAHNSTSMNIDNWRYSGIKYDGSDTWQYLSVRWLGLYDTEIPTIKPYTSIRASDNTALTVDNAVEMFSNMMMITTVDMSDWSDYMLQVNNIGMLFYNCSSLTSVNVTGLWHKNMIDMTGVFAGCLGLTEIIGLDTWMNNSENVLMRNLTGLFTFCSSLTQINGISTWNTKDVTNLSEIFKYCNKLESLDLGGWDIRDDADISNIFDGCTALTSIRIKKSASRLLAMLPGEITDWYIRLPQSYAQLTSTDWDNNWGSDEPRIFYKGGPSIYDLNEDFPAIGTSTTVGSWQYIYEGGGAYIARIADLTATAIPSDMPYNYIKHSSGQITPVIFSELCYLAASLTDVSNLANLPVRYAIGILSVFYGCTSLKTIISTANWDVRGVFNFQNMFATGNANENLPSVLETVDLSGWDLTTQDYTLTDMFKGCDKLNSVKISKTGEKILTVLPGEITDWKVNGTALTEATWNTSWGIGPIELTRDVA